MVSGKVIVWWAWCALAKVMVCAWHLTSQWWQGCSPESSQWLHFGHIYVIREATGFVFGFLLPFLIFCGLLAEDNANHALCGATLILSGLWILRQITIEVAQYRKAAAGHFASMWNVVDALCIALFLATVTLFAAGLPWWCKRIATATVVVVFLKLLQFLQVKPALGQLVQVRAVQHCRAKF